MTPDSYSSLTLQEMEQLDALTRPFEQALLGGETPSIAEALSNAPERLHVPLFRELLELTVTTLFERRQPAVPEEYIQRFPHFAETVRSVFEQLSDAGATRLVGTEDAHDETIGANLDTLLLSPDQDGPRRRLGSYEVESLLGRGGMGVVLKAWDATLERHVAIKLLAPELAGQEVARQRFFNEARAAAVIRHPNVVPIYAIEDTHSPPFLVLELVDGNDLAATCAGKPQSPQLAAELCQTVARAIHEAHQQGIIHRDLKPSNILIRQGRDDSRSGRRELAQDKTSGDDAAMEPTENGRAPDHETTERGRQRRTTDFQSVAPADRRTGSPSYGDTKNDAIPETDGRMSNGWLPQVTDFGLAKLADGDSDMTRTGEILGTPHYMAPEQADGLGRPVGTAADVYSLGCVLYWLLTGRPPFHGVSPIETLRMHVQDSPASPASLVPRLPADLASICLKCLEKEPHRRYSSAAALADDLGRFLNGEPTVARPVGAIGRSVRWARRHKTVAALLVSIALVALVGIVGVLWGFREAVIARGESEANELLAIERATEAKERQLEAEAATTRALDAEANVRREAEATRQQHYFNQIALAEQYRRQGNLEEARRVLSECPVDLRHIEWEVLFPRCRDTSVALTPQSRVTSLAITDDGKMVAMGLANGTVQLESVDATPFRTTDFQPVETTDGLEVRRTGTARTRFQGQSFPAHEDAVVELDFDTSGTRLMSLGRDNVLHIQDLETGTTIFSRELPDSDEQPVAMTDDGQRLAFADGTRVVIVDLADSDAVQDAGIESGSSLKVENETVLEGSDNVILDLAFSPSSHHVAAGTQFAGAVLWDIDTGEPLQTITSRVRDKRRQQVAFSDDGRTWFVGTWDVRAWNVADAALQKHLFPTAPQLLKELVAVTGHDLIVTQNTSNTVRVSDARTGRPIRFFYRAHRFALSRDGQSVVLAYGQSTEIHRLQSEPSRHTVPGRFHSFVPELGLAARTIRLSDRGRPGRTSRHDAVEVVHRSGDVVEQIPLPQGTFTHEAVLSRDGRSVVVASSDRKFRRWSRPDQSFTSIISDPPDFRRFSVTADGSRILRARSDGVQINQLNDEQNEWLPYDGIDHRSLIAVSETRLAVAALSAEKWLRVYDLQSGERLSELEPHSGVANWTLKFSPNERLVAGGDTSTPGDICLWDCQTGRKIQVLTGHPAGNHRLAFSPDSRRLVAASRSDTLQIWDVPTGQRIVAIQLDDASPLGLEFGANGTSLITWDHDSLDFWGDTSEMITSDKPIDLLSLIDPSTHTVSGEWQFVAETDTDGALQSDTAARKALHCQPHPDSRMEIPLSPEAGYQISLRVIRRSGNDSLAIYLPLQGIADQGGVTLFIVDGWPGRGHRTGLLTIDDVALPDRSGEHAGLLLNPGQEHRLDFEVSQHEQTVTIRARLDDTSLLDWTGPVSSLTGEEARSPQRMLRDVTRLGISTYATEFEIREATLELLGNTARVPVEVVSRVTSRP